MGVTHFLRVAALAHTFDLPVSPIGNTPVGLLHAATSLPNHIASELQDLHPPVGLSIDLSIEDGRFTLGDSPAWESTSTCRPSRDIACPPIFRHPAAPMCGPSAPAGGCLPQTAIRRKPTNREVSVGRAGLPNDRPAAVPRCSSGPPLTNDVG